MPLPSLGAAQGVEGVRVQPVGMPAPLVVPARVPRPGAVEEAGHAAQARDRMLRRAPRAAAARPDRPARPRARNQRHGDRLLRGALPAARPPRRRRRAHDRVARRAAAPRRPRQLHALPAEREPRAARQLLAALPAADGGVRHARLRPRRRHGRHLPRCPRAAARPHLCRLDAPERRRPGARREHAAP
eukprot:7070765-Prymnesium_polylepis.1